MTNTNVKLRLAIYLKGMSLDPVAVTLALGIKPTESQRFGEKNLTSTRREITAKTGLWAYIVEADEGTVADVIRRFICEMENCGNLVATLLDVDEAYLDLFIAHEAGPESDGEYFFEIKSEDLFLLSQFGLPIRTTVAAVTP